MRFDRPYRPYRPHCPQVQSGNKERSLCNVRNAVSKSAETRQEHVARCVAAGGSRHPRDRNGQV